MISEGPRPDQVWSSSLVLRTRPLSTSGSSRGSRCNTTQAHGMLTCTSCRHQLQHCPSTTNTFWMFLEPETNFGCLWTWLSDTDYQLHEPSPPATSVPDTAIKLSAKLLPLQGLTATIKTITQLLQSVRSPKLEKNAGWKSALEFIGSIPCLGDSTISPQCEDFKWYAPHNFRVVSYVNGSINGVSSWNVLLLDYLIPYHFFTDSSCIINRNWNWQLYHSTTTCWRTISCKC